MLQCLFAYGTLQLPERVKDIIGRPIVGAPTILEGYRCGRIDRADFPDIVPSAAASTPGCLLSGLTQHELSLLDRYEGELYRRIKVTVQVNGKPVRAWERVTLQPWSVDGYRRRIRKVRLTY